MTDTIELIDKAEVRDGQAIVKYSRTEHALAILREKYKDAKYDLTTTAGDKAARAARLELKTLRTDLEKKRAELKAPALLFGKTIDSEAARLTAEIQALETPIDAQIKADEKRREDERIAKEQAEAARRKVHTDGIAKIAGYVSLATDLPAERIAAGIAYLEALDLAGFEEFVTEATETRARAVSALQALHVKAVSREAEAARLEAERVEQARIAAEQAETARKLKEQQDEIDRQRAEVQQREDRIRREEADRVEREAQERAAVERAAAKVREELEAQEQARRAHALFQQREAMLEHVLGGTGMTQTTVDQDGTVEVKHIPTSEVLAYPPAPPAQALTTGPANVVPMPTKAPAATPPSLKLGAISERLGFTVTADFLTRMGFPPAAVQQNAKLFHEESFSAMCDAIVAHVRMVQEEARRKAA